MLFRAKLEDIEHNGLKELTLYFLPDSNCLFIGRKFTSGVVHSDSILLVFHDIVAIRIDGAFVQIHVKTLEDLIVLCFLCV